MKISRIILTFVLAAASLVQGCGGCGSDRTTEPDADSREPPDAGDSAGEPGTDAHDATDEGSAAEPGGGDADAADLSRTEEAEEEEIPVEVDPPDEFGSYVVGTFDDSFTVERWGEFVLTAYYPAVYEGFELVPAVHDAPYPGVAFIHGFMGNKDSNEWIGWHLASWGYVTVLVGVPNSVNFEPQQWSDGIQGAVTYLLEKNGEDGVLEGMVDGERIGAAGHSMGSMGTILATSQDERIRASVAMAPAYYAGGWPMEEFFDDLVSACGEIAVPVQLQVGRKDRICPPEGVQSYYDNLTKPKEILIIAGGNHMGFLDGGDEYERSVIWDNPADIPREEQERIAKKYMTAWFNYYLKGLAGYRTYLFGEEAGKDLDNGILDHLEFAE